MLCVLSWGSRSFTFVTYFLCSSRHFGWRTTTYERNVTTVARRRTFVFCRSYAICVLQHLLSARKKIFRDDVKKARKATRTGGGSRMMLPPGFQIHLPPCVTVTFELLALKIDRFMP